MGKLPERCSRRLKVGRCTSQKPIATGGRKELRWGWRVVRNSGAVMMMIVIITIVTVVRYKPE